MFELTFVVLVLFGLYFIKRHRLSRSIRKVYVKEAHFENPLIRLSYPTKIEEAGFVYFVHESGMNHIKIGKAKDLSKRLQNDFGTTMPYTFTVFHSIQSLNHHKTEKLFHRHFHSKRKSGEWFALTEGDLKWIKQGKYPEEISDSIKGC